MLSIYVFKIPMYFYYELAIMLRIIEKLEDIDQLCVLQQCLHDHTYLQ